MSKQDVDRVVDAVGVRQACEQCNVAGVLMTYRCSIACRHCCFDCSTERPNVVMEPRQCAEALALLHETGRVVHVAGGEAMLYWDVLRESIRLASQAGHAPHFIETNCSFAVEDGLVRDRFAFMKDHGVRGLLASADPYHQEFVPADRFLRVRRLAREIFGEKNFYGSGKADEDIRSFEGVARDPARLREHTRSHPPNMVGRAQRELSAYLDRFAPDDARLPACDWHGTAQKGKCERQFRAGTMWELHLDPYGNIQTNCGMILGRVADISPAELLARGPEKANRFVQTVAESGAVGLGELARREHGFATPQSVAQTCELCYLTRRFLRGFHPDVFGPAEVYG